MDLAVQCRDRCCRAAAVHALEDMPRADDTLRAQSRPLFELRNRMREINRGLLRPVGGVEAWQWLALGCLANHP